MILGASFEAQRRKEILVMKSFKGTNAPALLLAVLLFAAAAAIALSSSQSGNVAGYVVAGAVIAIVAWLTPKSLLIANQWEKAVVLRLGKLHSACAARECS